MKKFTCPQTNICDTQISMKNRVFAFMFLGLFAGFAAHGEEESSYAPIRWLSGSENSEAVAEATTTDDGSEESSYGPVRWLSESATNDLYVSTDVVEYDDAFASSLTSEGAEYYTLAIRYRQAYDRYVAAMQNYERQYARANRSAVNAEKDVNSALSMTSISDSDVSRFKSKAKGYVSVAQDYEAAVQELDAAVAELDKIERELASLRETQTGTLAAAEHERVHQELEIQL